jgi:hypothetical protein
MAFIQPCFIRKNTPELRKKLEELGYTNGAWESPHFDYPYLMCFPNRKFGLFKGEGFYMTEDDYRCDGKRWTYNPPKEYIDCGDNEELFISIAALRNDTDVNQWFVMDVEVYMDINQGDWFIATDRNKGKHIGTQIDPMYCHKATVEEIIEHFKKE